jgi:two-component system sensor histidine kinase ArlS
MKIRTKLILNYSVLSIVLLLLFTFIVIISYIKYRQSDFENRLRNRAASTAIMLINESLIDSSMLQIIDKNTIMSMRNFQITIYNSEKRIVFSNSKNPQPLEYYQELSKISYIESFSFNQKSLLFSHYRNDLKYLVAASAIDVYGLNELNSLFKILIWSLIVFTLFIIGFGFYNAIWSLKPFKKFIKEMDEINPSQISKRVSVQGNDELSQLAIAFNTLLDRIEQAFETEKSFISNASHELRTPVTSVMGQVEVALNKARSEPEYKAILQSVYDDASQMAIIINGFLELAEANLANNAITMKSVRIDELIFDVVTEFEKRKPNYNVSVEYLSNPQLGTQLSCKANERLLHLMFSNLVDNACKYSDNKKAKITIDFDSSSIIITIVDHGIGIPINEIDNIFKPLFRGSNATSVKGHGIGLAIVKRIADLHKITFNIKTELNIGTTVTVRINF